MVGLARVEVVLLSLGDGRCDCGGADAPGGCGTRTEVLACRDALRAAGARVETMTAHDDAAIDAALDRVEAGARLVVAAAADGQLRAVVRRLVRRYAPAPSARPADLPADRTMPDLPPIAILALGPRMASGADPDLAARLGLPREPAAVAAAVLIGRVRRIDLLRTDAGSVTLDGALFGAADDGGRAVPFTARVEVDDAVLSDGSEHLLVTAVANADGYAAFDGLPLLPDVESADGVLDVAVAVPTTRRAGLLRRRRVEIEVRRAHGRAVVVIPTADLPFLDDGVAGTLGRKRTWWMERGAWAVYTG